MYAILGSVSSIRIKVSLENLFVSLLVTFYLMTYCSLFICWGGHTTYSDDCEVDSNQRHSKCNCWSWHFSREEHHTNIIFYRLFHKLSMYQGRSISFLYSFTFINPKFHKGVGGGSPRFLDSGALNIDLRGPKFWYNSYFVITMSVQNVQDLKGVPEKKIRVWLLSQGSKSKSLKCTKKF